MRSVLRLVVCLLATGMVYGCSSAPKPKKRQRQRRHVGPRHLDDPSKPAASNQSAQDLFVDANKLLDAGKYEQAVGVYDRALARDDTRWDIYMNKAIAHSAQQQLSPAVDAIDQALAHGGDTHAEVYFNLGNIYQNRGMYAQSIKAYRTSMTVGDGPQIDAKLNIAAALSLMRHFGQAKQAYQHLKSRAPDDPRVYLGLGLVEQNTSHYKDALRYYEQVNRMAPDFSQGWFNKGALLSQMKRRDQAIASYQRYLEVAPDGPYAKRAANRIKQLRARQ